MSLPAIAANNLTYDFDARNLLVTTDISTGDIIFTSEKHGISPKVLGSLFAEVSASSTASAPSIRVYEVDSEGNEIRTILKRKRAFFFFCMADGTDVPSRVSTSTDGPTMATEVVAYLNEIFQKTAATTPLTLDFGPSDLLDVTLDSTSTTLLFSNGRTHAVNSIKAFETSSGLVNIRDFSGSNDLMRNVRHGNITIAGESAGLTAAAAVNSLNSMFQLSAVGSGRVPVPAFYREDPTSITNNMAEEFIPTTGLIGANSLNTDGHGSRLWSTEKIKNPGEEFVVKITGEGDFMIGLVQEGTTQFSELTDNSSSLTHAAAMTWGHMFQDNTTHISPQQNYGTLTGVIQGVGWQGSDKLEIMRYNSEVQDNFSNGNPNLFKIAINADRRIELSYYDAGRTNAYILIARSSAAISFSDGYHLVVKLIDGDVKVTETPFISTVTADNTSGLVYYYIESPDGSYDYPLFNSTQQAAQQDINAGGSGVYSSRVYVDDPTNTTWYAPVTAFTEDATSAPLDTTTITYNEIATEADALYAPAPLTLQNYTVDEGDSLNIQTQPAGQTPVVAITNLPTGLTAVGGNITGTAPYVSGDTSTNPSVTHTITATRSNEYGSTTQTFDLIVNNLTAPATSVSGFGTPTGPQSGTVLGDTDGVSSSSVELNETLDAGKRFIIPETWVEANILPYFDNEEDKVFFGVPKSNAVMSSVTLSDFDMVLRLQARAGFASHKSLLYDNGANDNEVVVASATDAYYNYAIEWDGTDLHIIAGNLSDINAQPAVSNGGTFDRVITHSSFTEQSGSLPLALAVNEYGQVNLDATGLSEIDIPYGANDIRVSETSETDARFDVGSGPVTADNITINAGYTYRFYLNNASIESGDTLTFETLDGTAYTTGVTTVGSHGDYNYYVQFAVPTDVPPIRPVWNGTDLPAIGISGSTYVTTVTGITLEGPSANQTGTNLFDAGDNGWLSIDEPLGAGQRLVLSGAFLADVADAMGDNSLVSFGLKDGNWANTISSAVPSGFEGGMRISIYRASATNFQLYGYNGDTSSTTTILGGGTLYNPSQFLNYNAFLEVTSSGNNVRVGYALTSTSNANTVAYADWASTTKIQSGDQGYGISTVDVMVQGFAISGTDTTDANDIDWTALTEIPVPTPTAPLTTPWTRALDFSGSAERAQMVSTSTSHNPIMMGGVSTTVAAPSVAGQTSNNTNARPWATAIVFQYDGNSSNQHIWNLGEGAGSTNDNIYLRIDSTGQVHFGWGRQGAVNECEVVYLGTSTNTSHWHGFYIAHNGTRLSGTDATAANLAAAFDIRWFTTNFTGGVFGSWMDNKSTTANWTAGTTGGRMDRTVSGAMTVGGRGSNRNFHGKVASMVVTTLKTGVTMPTDAEISMMVRDPQQWMTDYKVGQTYRLPAGTANYGPFALNQSGPAYGTQVWLMGDGTSDAYAQIRNDVYPSIQNVYPLNMISMVSNDIVTVNIPGLT